jgi:hypothetical protein
MNTWTPLWSGIVDSSLWEEDGNVVKVFMTMIATKDSDHICRLDAYRIARKCHIDEIKVLEILKTLASPDTRRVSKQEHEGRRIQAVEDGWLILNGAKYRKMVSEEMRKARLRRAQATFREKQKTQDVGIILDKKEKSNFEPPTLDECKARAVEIGLDEVEGEKFFHHYTANGWFRGKTKMKIWKSALQTWKMNAKQYAPKNSKQTGHVSAC